MDAALSLFDWSIWPWIAGIVGFFGGGVFAVSTAVSTHIRQLRADLGASGDDTHIDQRLNAANALIAHSWRSLYLASLRKSLESLDLWMGTLSEPTRGFSWSLAAAFIYPSAIILFSWMLGGPAQIGATNILPAADSFSQADRLHILIALLLAGSICFSALMNRAKIVAFLIRKVKKAEVRIFIHHNRGWAGYLFRLTIWTSGALTFFIFRMLFDESIPESIFFVMLLYIFASIMFFILSHKLAKDLIMALLGCVFIYITLLAIGLLLPSFNTQIFFVTMIIPATVAGVIISRGIVGDNITTAALAVTLTTMLWLDAGSIDDRQITSWILFWAIVPLSNALFDWLSWVVSRWLGNNLLEISEARDIGTLLRAWIYVRDITIDFLAACALLVGLAWSLPRVIELWNGIVSLSGAKPPLELAGYLCNAATTPLSDGLWATGMLVSTLIPTVLHLSIIAVAPLIWCLTPTETMRARAGHIAFGWRPPDVDLKGISLKDREKWPPMEPVFGQRTLADDVSITTESLHPPTVSAIAWTLRFWRPLFFIGAFIVVLTVIWQLGSLVSTTGGSLPELLLWIAHNFDYEPVRQCFPKSEPMAPFEALTI